ncbi:MAG: flagellar biosynthesis anti-sigma factor FlgM [Lachnospiraceae bacterium]|jgi:anti-sigma28 factor (negative regulator of flagellin synthesis)|nr:flagellar biosynthesis anti-sigma factor FlgM [Lachnospiraceae bacterium]
MKVNLYGTSMVGRDYSSFYRTASSVPGPVKQQTADSIGSYDKLTLHQTQYPSDTKQFARLLAKEAAKDISAPAADDARVAELRRQAEAGTYIPDAGQIAKHMLCY